MNEEEKKALKVINARTRRLLDELEIEKEDMSDEPKIAYLMQEIRANKTILNLIEKLQKEHEELKLKYKLLYNGKIEMIKARELKIPNSVVSKQKIKDKIEHYQKLQDSYIEKYDKISKGLQAMINALQELLEGEELGWKK